MRKAAIKVFISGRACAVPSQSVLHLLTGPAAGRYYNIKPAVGGRNYTWWSACARLEGFYWFRYAGDSVSWKIESFGCQLLRQGAGSNRYCLSMRVYPGFLFREAGLRMVYSWGLSHNGEEREVLMCLLIECVVVCRLGDRSGWPREWCYTEMPWLLSYWTPKRDLLY